MKWKKNKRESLPLIYFFLEEVWELLTFQSSQKGISLTRIWTKKLLVLCYTIGEYWKKGRREHILVKYHKFPQILLTFRFPWNIYWLYSLKSFSETIIVLLFFHNFQQIQWSEGLWISSCWHSISEMPLVSSYIHVVQYLSIYHWLTLRLFP